MSFLKKILAVTIFCCVFASLGAVEVRVVEVSGKVEVQKGDKWVAVSKGDILSAGSVISTGFKSEAVIALDETVIKVKALTRLTIEQLFEKDGNKASSVYLDTGSISADVKPAENKRVGFSVKTPAATASVRGTSGDVFSDGTVVGTSGKWCITGPEAKIVFNQNAVVADLSSSDETSSENGEPVVGAEQMASESVDALASSVETPAEQPSVTGIWEAFDFSYPDVPGAVYVNAGENAIVSGGSFITPQENKVQQTTGNTGVQLLSETEKVVPVAPQAVTESYVRPSAETVVVPEKPKYGTVQLTITLPTL